MNFTDLFIRRPVVATVVNLIILLAGFQAIRSLNVRQYPRSDIAVVTVTTVYVGANADLVRGFITTPLERVIASADGIDYIESSSAQGVSTITVHLKLNYDNNAALTQIQAKVAQVRNDLPPEAEAPIIEIATSDSQFAAAYLSFYSKDLDQNQITDYLTRVVQPKLTAISGVQRADILGARTFAMRIWLKADRLAALNISPSQVHDALAANNFLSAVGATKGSMISVNLTANTDLRTPDEFRELVIRQQNGAIVRLKDVADVELGAESYDEDVRFSGEKATFMGIWALPTANSLDVIKAVRAELPQIEKQLPVGMKVGVPYDSTKYISDALHEVTHTLLETLVIVIVVIFLFLGSFRSVLIPVVAIPISLIGAAFLMLLFGFTLNLLTLLAIVLSVGLVVDDAIVVVENVERHLHEGLKPYDAAIKGARELFAPDHCHDHHTGGCLRPDWVPGRPHGDIISRVCPDAGRRRAGFRVCRPDLVSHDVVKTPAHGRFSSWICRLDQQSLRQAPPTICQNPHEHVAVAPGDVDVGVDRHSPDGSFSPAFATRAGAERGPGRGLWDCPGRAEFHH